MGSYRFWNAQYFGDENVGKAYMIEDLHYTHFIKEYHYGNSRIDFLLKNDAKCLLEVKGCTLIKDGMALFPDAPTGRGRKHIEELIEAKKDGYRAAILFLIMRKDAMAFAPNEGMDPRFTESLKNAFDTGMGILLYAIEFDGRNFSLRGEIPISW
jgi:sugar fermentation stimulation protein A